jgi:hypothetical protein
MVLSIKVNGIFWQMKEMEEECKSGLMGADMKVTGRKTRQMERED